MLAEDAYRRGHSGASGDDEKPNLPPPSPWQSMAVPGSHSCSLSCQSFLWRVEMDRKQLRNFE